MPAQVWFMHPGSQWIGSESVGDPARFQSIEKLEAGLREISAPRDRGEVVMLVARGEGGRRAILKLVRLEPDAGMPGDAWERRPKRKPETSLAVMQSDVAELIANGQPLELSGDNLYLALDLSKENLPTGSRVRAGQTILEVTPYPHNGCAKFRARFGEAAVHFTARPELRHRNLRGIYMRVVEGGDVRAGDAVEVIWRGPGDQPIGS
jgi:hypothetical protein